MTARVAQMPPNPYRPASLTDCMVECGECGSEWGWGASYERCTELAKDHNRKIHPEGGGRTVTDRTEVHERVTRIEIIDDEGRSFARRYTDAGCYVQLQDDGRTLKIFAGTPEGEDGQ